MAEAAIFDVTLHLRSCSALAFYVAWLVRSVLLALDATRCLPLCSGPSCAPSRRSRSDGGGHSRATQFSFCCSWFAGALTAFGFLALPPVVHDLQEFGKEVAPTRLPRILEKLKHVPFADRVDDEEVNAHIQDFISNAATYLLLSIKNWASALFI